MKLNFHLIGLFWIFTQVICFNAYAACNMARTFELRSLGFNDAEIDKLCGTDREIIEEEEYSEHEFYGETKKESTAGYPFGLGIGVDYSRLNGGIFLFVEKTIPERLSLFAQFKVNRTFTQDKERHE